SSRARRPTSASTSTIIPSHIPTCAERSRCSPISTRCASSTASTSSLAIPAPSIKGAQIEDGTHVAALVAQKHAARRHRATHHLAAAVPAVEGLLVRAAERGGNLGSITATLMQLLARYGAAELEAAVLEALERNVPHPNAVRLVLERRRQERQEPPPIAVILPEHIQTKDRPVRPHDLAAYDKLKETPDED